MADGLTRTPTGAWRLPPNTVKPEPAMAPLRSASRSAYADVEGITVERRHEGPESEGPSQETEETQESQGTLFITVTKTSTQPLIITHQGDARTSIAAEPGTQAIIIERFPTQARHEVKVRLDENSDVTHITIQAGGYHGTKQALATRNARMHWFELDLGAGESDVSTELSGEGASTNNDSIFLAPVAFTAEANHAAPFTTSRLLTKGVLDNQRAIYEGILRIAESAPKSDAFQRAECLLLGEAEIKASPRLFIENNDVRCSHAATATHIDADKLFYLGSRGISEADAQRMLIRAFLWPVIEELDQQVQRIIVPIIDERLETICSGNDGRGRTAQTGGSR